MTAKELISQYVDTGLQLPEYQVTKLSNQDKKTYIRKRLIAAQSGQYLDSYEMAFLNPDERDNYISNLDSSGIATLLRNSSDKDKVINVLLNNDTLISKMDSSGIEILLKSSSEPKMIMKVLGDKGRELMNNLKSDRIYWLLRFSSEPEMVMDLLDYKVKVIEFISKLGSGAISGLLNSSKNPEAIKRIFDKYGIDYPKNESVKSLLRKKMIYL
jgi:hypothetical protein